MPRRYACSNWNLSGMPETGRPAISPRTTWGTLDPLGIDSYVLLRPVELRLGDTCGSTVCFGFAPPLHVATGIPKALGGEHNERLLCRTKVAVPAPYGIEGTA